MRRRVLALDPEPAESRVPAPSGEVGRHRHQPVQAGLQLYAAEAAVEVEAVPARRAEVVEEVVERLPARAALGPGGRRARLDAPAPNPAPGRRLLDPEADRRRLREPVTDGGAEDRGCALRRDAVRLD